jgi:Flp pilus assembly protein TadG
MPGPLNVFRRFIASTRGVAAIEFAMILPVLLIGLLATFDAANAIAVYMKVRSATYILAAITNQYSISTPIQSTDMTSITGATSAVLSPYSNTPTVVVISQLAIAAGGQSTATVDWSATLNGTALVKGNSVTLPSTIATSTNTCSTYPCYLIYAQVSYKYTPMFGYFAQGGITLSDSVFVAPRSSVCIPYVPVTGTTCP